MVQGYAILLISLLSGYLLGRLKSLPQATPSVLYFFVINIALPATILVSIRNITISYDLLIPVAAQWASLLITALIVVAVSSFFKFDRLTTGTILLVVPLGNTAFLGLSVIPVFFGKNGIPYGVMYDQLGSFLALVTYGTAVAGVYGTSGRTDIKSLIIKIITFPSLIFLVIGFMLKDYAIPQPLNSVISLLSKTLVPAAMISIGLNLSFKLKSQLYKPLLSALLIRLIFTPAVILIFFYTLGLTSLAARIGVFQAAMPSMIMAAVLASDKGLDKTLATTIVSIGIAASLATLPLIYFLIELLLL
jgi:predicted permease